jgi:hypothetical protein
MGALMAKAPINRGARSEPPDARADLAVLPHRRHRIAAGRQHLGILARPGSPGGLVGILALSQLKGQTSLWYATAGIIDPVADSAQLGP